MPKSETKAERKHNFHIKLSKMLDEYQQLLVVGIDNISSDHMQQIRKAVRGLAIILCGKNTLIRRTLRIQAKTKQELETLLPHVTGNVALVFTKGSLAAVKKKLLELRVSAAAKAGAIAPSIVIVPKGPTGLEPTKTSFLQALNITRKINRGQIEIIADKILIEANAKVGQSEAALLQMLNIRPFSYGMTVDSVYDSGSMYDVSVLDWSDEEILKKFLDGVRNVACIGLSIGYPTIASLPHSIINGYKKILSIAMATTVSFPRADQLKQIAANPDAFKQVNVPKPQEVKEEVKEEVPEEKPEDPEDGEDLGMGGGLFGGGDDEW